MSKLKQARLELPPLDFSIVKDKQIINTPNSDQPKAKPQKDYSKTETQSDKMLLCIDWDGTIVKGSLDNALNTTLNYQDCVDRFLADETKNWKNKELLVKLFQKALTIGCHIAIVSFGSYPDWIKYALEQLLGSTLSKEIYVVSHPRRNDYEGKQEHIEEAKRHFGVSENKKVVLIDDDLNNVNIAKKNDMQGIYVTKEGIEYLKEASEIVTEQEPKENQIQTNFDQPTESIILLMSFLSFYSIFRFITTYFDYPR